jgi:hypothetical protein
MGRVFLSPSKASSGTTGAKPVRSLVDDAVRSPSKPLDLETRKFMEPRFHYDFSNVRIHADDSAGRASRALNASAFTVGRHVIFDSGHYDPHTRAGRRLLAHELTHVAQQGDHATSVDGAQVVADAQDPAEQEAVAAADRVAVGQPVDVRRNAGGSIYRNKQISTKVPLGTYAFDMQQQGNPGLVMWEDVKIDFSPDLPPKPQPPKSLGGKPDEYHDLNEPTGQELPVPDVDFGLPAGLTLTIPGAVAGGFSVDIDPKGNQPRGSTSAPNISPNYPHLKKQYSSGHFSPTPGHNLPGNILDAGMTDLPGHGQERGVFEFESAAHAEDLGLFYGSVHWGFHSAQPP